MSLLITTQMNTMAKNVPNKIKQPAQCCVHCGRSYKKRENLNKHLPLCELLQRSKKRSKTRLIIEEDDADVIQPSQSELFQMLIELGDKYNKLEEKVNVINKWVIKKKKTINVIDWLNTNMAPNITYETIIDKILIIDSDIKHIIANPFYDTLNEIFTRTIYNFNETENPIFCFVQKQNTFYIYNLDKIWVELSSENLIRFIDRVHTKLSKSFYEWKIRKENDVNVPDSVLTSYDKTLVKLMSVELRHDSTMSKIKSAMFARMKMDMKGLVEYDFEF